MGNNIPTICRNSTSLLCRVTEANKLSICAFGVSYIRTDNNEIQRKVTDATQDHLATNLRHELHKIIQFIINECCNIMPNLSLFALDKVDTPAKRIAAAADLMDKTIEKNNIPYWLLHFKKFENFDLNSHGMVTFWSQHKNLQT